ncbi:Lrp/AsnC family transcriptional regulator [Colwellia sp. M166]|uniref:siroheme decarboxylase subunit beta n=1 Tax=Colwellia sp. M166 TaxID=2583805 RepID=UPI00211E71EA|nr:Lrp/AsnC family transcriptional regulator [Colwellia sp. M166]UUO21973.1 Lrp/AsnC family transcriptional regulator [Colwellia sp. M166]|tara:strand:+ start:10239 stop:10784 length:546 start_codon:yes stop_codon:yes gene_type:complete
MSNYTSQPNIPLSALERQFVLLTQSGLPIVSQPYQHVAEQLQISVAEVLAMTTDLKERGIIRRIAAVPNHYKLGYRYNGMTVWDVKDEDVSEFGQAVGRLPFVSHCYLRPRHLPQWNYNLFAMVHGKTVAEVQQYRTQIKDLLINVLQVRNDDSDHGVKFQTNDMLTSTEILKKTGLRLKR